MSNMAAANVGAGWVLCLITVVGSVSAQQMLPAGTSVGGGANAIVGPLVLPFSFRFPGGVETDRIEVSTNGSIHPASLATAGGSPVESVAELLSAGPSIRCYWDDLSAVDQVFLDVSQPGVATVTWVDTREYAGNVPFTVQAQLRADGSVAVVWDERAAADGLHGDCIVGLSSGDLGVDPGSVDFSAVATDGVVLAPIDTVYERFSATDPASRFDLACPCGVRGLDFAPTYPGYVVSGTVPAPRQAGVRRGRRACEGRFEPFSWQFEPTPVPGGGLEYALVSEGAAPFRQPPPNSRIAIQDDRIVPVDLPFAFRMPGGSVVTSVSVDTNGRILAPGAVHTSDRTPTIAEFLQSPTATIAPLWADLDLFGVSIDGGVYLHADDAGTEVFVTWENVAQAHGSRALSFQVALRADGGIRFAYASLDVNPADEFFGPAGTNALIGVTPGGGAAAGQTDLSASIPFGVAATTSNDETLFEFFAAGGGFDLGPGPDPNATDAILALTAPVVGTDFRAFYLDTRGGATGIVYMLGLPTGVAIPSIPLGSVFPALRGCELLTDAVTPGATIAVVAGPVSTEFVQPIPDVPELVGLDGLSLSGLVLNPTTSPGLFPLDELVLRVGV
jgi:hypothetical protein